MSPTIPSEYVQGLDQLLADLRDATHSESKRDGETLDVFKLRVGLFEPSKGVSVWLGCHATEGLRKLFESKVGAVDKTLIRIVRAQAILETLRRHQRTSPRVAKILRKRVAALIIRGVELHSLWSTLKRCHNIPGSPTPHTSAAHLEVDSLADVTPSQYQKVWNYAQQMWAHGSDKYKICEHLTNGPGNYSECVEDLIPNVGRSAQTNRFHSVLGSLNKEIRDVLALEVYRWGAQILVCEVGRKPLEHKRKSKKTNTKKPTTKKCTTKRNR